MITLNADIAMNLAGFAVAEATSLVSFCKE